MEITNPSRRSIFSGSPTESAVEQSTPGILVEHSVDASDVTGRFDQYPGVGCENDANLEKANGIRRDSSDDNGRNSFQCDCTRLLFGSPLRCAHVLHSYESTEDQEREMHKCTQSDTSVSRSFIVRKANDDLIKEADDNQKLQMDVLKETYTSNAPCLQGMESTRETQDSNGNINLDDTHSNQRNNWSESMPELSKDVLHDTEGEGKMDSSSQERECKNAAITTFRTEPNGERNAHMGIMLSTHKTQEEVDPILECIVTENDSITADVQEKFDSKIRDGEMVVNAANSLGILLRNSERECDLLQKVDIKNSTVHGPFEGCNNPGQTNIEIEVTNGQINKMAHVFESDFRTQLKNDGMKNVGEDGNNFLDIHIEGKPYYGDSQEICKPLQSKSSLSRNNNYEQEERLSQNVNDETRPCKNVSEEVDGNKILRTQLEDNGRKNVQEVGDNLLDIEGNPYFGDSHEICRKLQSKTSSSRNNNYEQEESLLQNLQDKTRSHKNVSEDINGNENLGEDEPARDKKSIACEIMHGTHEKDLHSMASCATVKHTQKPRSTRSNSGAKKSTWGLIDVFPEASQDMEIDQEKLTSEFKQDKGPKKRRQSEMTPDGDMEWEALTGESEMATGKLRKSRRAKSVFESGLVPVGLNGDIAAVTVGLRLSTLAPAERIRFKDLLKRRSGIQEYLECRNMILGLWERDMKHILSVTDCGISPVASEEETPRVSLIREIYDFLNYHGYINIGIATDKSEVPSASPIKQSEAVDGCNVLSKLKRVSDNSLAVDTTASDRHSSSGVATEFMDVDEKLHERYENEFCNQEILHPLEEQVSAELGEESLLDIFNKIKANRRKKAALQKSGKISNKHEKNDLSESLNNVICKDMSVVTTKEDNTICGHKKNESISMDFQTLKDKSIELDMTPFANTRMADTGNPNLVEGLANNHECNTKDKWTTDSNVKKVDKPELGCSGATFSVNKMPENDKRRVIIVGAGPAGLIAGRHLKNVGADVMILEARQRVGGRVCTDRTVFSGPVDLGASIITGVEADIAAERRPDPTALLCKQLDLELTTLGGDCPLFDFVTGSRVPCEIDEGLEAEYNRLLDDTIMLVAQDGDVAMQMSLEEGLELVLSKRKEQENKASHLPIEINTSHDESPTNDIHKEQTNRLKYSCNLLDRVADSSSLERRVLDWHFANLEYGCAAELKRVSLPYWNQDDVYGGFAGPHCMIKGGYSTVMEALGSGLTIKLGQIVTKIEYRCKEDLGQVKVHTECGDLFIGDVVLVTIPLGCLKVGSIEFIPSLPEWKTASIQRLGFGVLNKVIMEFPVAFWDETVDFFGSTAENGEMRGRCFMFWNLKRTVGAPVLSALVVGKAAIEEERKDDSESVEHALTVLRKIYGEESVPQPTAFAVTRWGSDPFSRGAYSFVAIGASGEDYDIIGRSVNNSVFFAGEATCKEHPDTVGGAIMSGIREAVRIADVLYNRSDSIAEAEAIAASQVQSDTERIEVRDMTKRLAAADISIAIRREPFSKASLLQDMFGNAKTMSGRLLVAKEMLQLSASSLKSFVGTKEGLRTLNVWIQDSLGKDGTKLLRHCVHLLLVVGKDLSSIRQSGIGRTVKEKVIVHTSRDIRSIASQLVKLWVETFRREKAAGGITKSLQHSNVKTSHTLSKMKINAKSAQKTNDKSSAFAVSSVTSKHPDADIDGKDSVSACSDTSRNQPVPISDSEAVALAAAEAAKAAADAAVKAYATAEAASTQFELPKIMSFHKFAKREHITPADSNKRRSLEQEMLLLHGKDQVTTGVNARNCKVRDWSIDFSDSCSYLGSPSLLVMQNIPNSSRSGMVSEFNGMSAETVAEEVHNTLEGRHSLEKEVSVHSMQEAPDEVSERSDNHESKGNSISGSTHPNKNLWNTQNTSAMSSADLNMNANEPPENANNMADLIDSRRNSKHKKAVTEYVSSLLLPLYKARKISKDGFKSIVKKSAVKVIERQTEQEVSLEVFQFLDTKRKLKIRALVDKFVERYQENGGR